MPLRLIVAFGSTLATILLNSDVAFPEGLTALVLLAGLQFLVASLSAHVPGPGQLLRHDRWHWLCPGNFSMPSCAGTASANPRCPFDKNNKQKSQGKLALHLPGVQLAREPGNGCLLSAAAGEHRRCPGAGRGGRAHADQLLAPLPRNAAPLVPAQQQQQEDNN